MGTEQDKTAAAKDEGAPAASEREQGVLAHDDLLSGASLVLPAVAAAGEPAPEASDAIPGLNDVLTVGEQGFAGGLLTFDNASSPGNTIVLVTFEGDAAQNAYEVATLPGVVTDINSLLGLLGHDAHHA
ncbi:MAG: hypothetical protein Q8L89_06375 [Gammaproteobacteria bacterium]|nr:hypothetical protein [Gammaproteobacteria bacterium]